MEDISSDQDTESELPQQQETNKKTSRFSKEIRKWCMFYYHDMVWVKAAGSFPRPGRYERYPGGWYNKVSRINIDISNLNLAVTVQ